MSFWDAWANSRRNARAAAAAGALFLAIGLMLSMRCNPVVERWALEAEVLEVEATGLRATGGAAPKARVVVRTPEGVDLRLLLPPPVPGVGDGVPLLAERHRNGDTHHALNLQEWLTDGPRPGEPSVQPGASH